MEEAKHGTYRNKATILQIYDALADWMRNVSSPLEPTARRLGVCHPSCEGATAIIGVAVPSKPS